MANGKVITGYSLPQVAVYNATGNTVSYTDWMPLARGVSVAMDITTADSVDFHADNVLAESTGKKFESGQLTLTIDGLKDAARKLIMGLPTATSMSVGTETVDVYDYDDDQDVPYVGIGFVVRYMEAGQTSYAGFVCTKCMFDQDSINAATQGENIEFQTSELTAAMMRDDSTKHRWRRITEEVTSEAVAGNAVKVMLGGTIS